MYTDVLSLVAVSQILCFVISPVSVPASVGMTSMGAPNTQFQVCLLELIISEPFTKYFWLTASAWEDKCESESHSIHGCWIWGSYFSRLSLCHPFPTFLHCPWVGRYVALAIFPNWRAPSSLREEEPHSSSLLCTVRRHFLLVIPGLLFWIRRGWWLKKIQALESDCLDLNPNLASGYLFNTR